MAPCIRIRLKIVGVLCAAALTAYLLFLFLSLSPEPSFRGRTLTQWLQDPTLEGREGAVLAIGTNAIPTLLKMASFRYHGHDRAHNLQHPFAILRRADCYTAQQGFEILRETARPAIPALIELTKNKDKDIRANALNCLLLANPDKGSVLPILLSLSHDTNYGLRASAGMELIQRYPDEAAKANITEDYLRRRDTLPPGSPQYLPRLSNQE